MPIACCRQAPSPAGGLLRSHMTLPQSAVERVELMAAAAHPAARAVRGAAALPATVTPWWWGLLVLFKVQGAGLNVRGAPDRRWPSRSCRRLQQLAPPTDPRPPDCRAAHHKWRVGLTAHHPQCVSGSLSTQPPPFAVPHAQELPQQGLPGGAFPRQNRAGARGAGARPAGGGRKGGGSRRLRCLAPPLKNAA
jgi:hypothetical protein